jgi:hypothetical protein
MPGLTPGRRWQPAYFPFHRDSLFDRAVETVERTVKGTLFGCRMCGNCLLQETAFICPMECPKGLRNGPCGGSTPEHCYVDPTRPCVWYKIYERAEALGAAIGCRSAAASLEKVAPTLEGRLAALARRRRARLRWPLAQPAPDRAQAWSNSSADRQPDW